MHMLTAEDIIGLRANNLARFKAILEKWDNPALSKVVLDRVYEKLLSTPDSAEFIKIFIDRDSGYKHYVNESLNKSAIHFAVESLHFSNLLILLCKNRKHDKDRTRINVDQRNLQGQTPLNYYAKAITVTNVDELRECMELLLYKGASVSTRDGDDLSPLDYVMSSTDLLSDDRYKLVVMLLLRNKRELTDEAWFYIKKILDIIENVELSGRKRFINTHIDGFSTQTDNICYILQILNRESNHKIADYLENTFTQVGEKLSSNEWTDIRNNLSKIISDMHRSRKILENMLYNEKVNYQISLLQILAKNNDRKLLNILLQTLCTNSNDDSFEILQKAREYGKMNLFNDILSAKSLCLDKCTAIKLAKKIIHTMNNPNAKELFDIDMGCFKCLIESRYMDCSDADDVDGIPLLSYAADECNEIAVKELLKQGAYLGMRSDYKIIPVAHIRPVLLEKHLDSCISMEKESRKQNIVLNMKNICHPPMAYNIPKIGHNDMTTISHMKNSRDLQHLLTHPVVTIFLYHKWQQYSKFFYLHLFIYCIFLILMTTHIICNVLHEGHQSTAGTRTIPYFCCPFILYLLVREVVQIYLGLPHYLKTFFMNLMDIAIILLSSLTCLDCWTEEISNIFATYTLLFTFFKLFIIMRLLPIQFISMPLLMLFEVVKTVLKNSVLIAVVGVFSVCFRIRFGYKMSMEHPGVEVSENSTDGLTVNFNTIISSFLKTTIMSTGEYDAGNMQFKTIFDFHLLFVFVIVGGISLFNLLTALAVSDIQMIKDQADIIRAINRVNFENMCEEFLNNMNWRILYRFLEKPAVRPVKKITIRLYRYPFQRICHTYQGIPNANNQSNTYNMEQELQPLFTKKSVTINQNNLKCNETNREQKDDYVPPAQSIIAFTKTKWKDLKELLLPKDFNIDFVDDKTVKRAIEIAEKNAAK